MTVDISTYDGPIQRADGRRPYNHYLWPTEDWWLSHEDQFRNLGGMFHFGVIHLWDGTFATDGEVWCIAKNVNIYGQPCVYKSRETAIRVSAARMIRDIRSHAERDQWIRKCLNRMVNWTLETVSEVCTEEAHRKVCLPDPPPPAPPNPVAGLELFEQGVKHDQHTGPART
jgi:hypothetical protein